MTPTEVLMGILTRRIHRMRARFESTGDVAWLDAADETEAALRRLEAREA